MKTRNKVKLITTIICMVLSLIALYAFCFVVEVAPVWRVILIIIKRKQKGPVGSSGGLWRLAYALWSMREFA